MQKPNQSHHKYVQSFWFGIHLLVHNDDEINNLAGEIPALASQGINFIIPEVNYHFAYKTHPELREKSVIHQENASMLSQICADNGIRVIPQFQCLGHQSWAEHTFPLLTVYPEFDETPGLYDNNEGIYCRSWCPQHPDINTVIFSLIDELLEAFRATSIHVGLDEVFLLGSENCPRCAGHDKSELFAKAVNDLYDYIVKHKGNKMLMWGDRLLNASITEYGEWEAAANGTDLAIDKIPNDIVICDWHYTTRAQYPSLPIFLEKGFRVLASGWHDIEASHAFYDYAVSLQNPNMVGYLCTTWGKVKPGSLSTFPAFSEISKKAARNTH